MKLKIMLCCAVSALAPNTPTASAQGKAFQPEIFATGDFSDSRSVGEIELLFPLLQNKNTLLFVNSRGMIDSNDSRAVNAGLGLRHLASDDVIVGAYGIYDRLRSDNGNSFNQTVVGAEVMGDAWDIRFNYYRAFNRTRRLSRSTNVSSATSAITGDDLFLSGNFLFANQTVADTAVTNRTFERAHNGWEAEAGYELFKGLRAFGGYYDFSALNADISGPKGRIEWNLADSLGKDWGFDITLTGFFTDDDVRGSQFAGGLRISVPLGKPKERSSSARLRDRMTEWVRRDFDLVTNVSTSTTVARSERTVQTQVSDQVYRFFDNSAPDGGDGTFENPYSGFFNENRIAHPTEEGDILFVYAGDDEYFGVQGLLEGQSLIGEASGLQAMGTFLIEPGDRPLLRVVDSEGPTRPEAVIIAMGNNLISGVRLSGDGSDTAISASLSAGEHLTIENTVLETSATIFDDTQPDVNFAGIGIMATIGNNGVRSGAAARIIVSNSSFNGSGSGIGVTAGTDDIPLQIELNENIFAPAFNASALRVSSRTNTSIVLNNNEFVQLSNFAANIGVADSAHLSFQASGNSFVGNGTGFHFSNTPFSIFNLPPTVQTPGSGIHLIDLGGGALNAAGGNRIFFNGTNISSSYAVDISATGNFWQGAPDDASFDLFPGSNIDTGDFLMADPAPNGPVACPNEQQVQRDSETGSLSCS